MTAEKRKHDRRAIKYPALIDAGDSSPLRECTLHDVSEDGAQIVVAAPADLPDEFTLTLGYDGTARRHCRVMWRSEIRVGVKFLRDAANAQPASTWAAAIERGELKSDTVKAPAGE